MTGDYLLLQAPGVEVDSKKAKIDIEIAVTGDAQLVVVEMPMGDILFTTDLEPGKVQRIDAEVSLSADDATVSVFLNNVAGKQKLYAQLDKARF
jgi:hypothetical protein